MKLRITGIVVACIGLFCPVAPTDRPLLAAGPAAAETITVYNPWERRRRSPCGRRRRGWTP